MQIFSGLTLENGKSRGYTAIRLFLWMFLTGFFGTLGQFAIKIKQ